MAIADEVSCKAMSGLAKQELVDNLSPLLYQTNHPVCDRFQELSDRDKESHLQFSLLTRDICMKKKPEYHQGTWETMMQPIMKEDIRFDMNTRRKVASGAASNGYKENGADNMKKDSTQCLFPS